MGAESWWQRGGAGLGAQTPSKACTLSPASWLACWHGLAQRITPLAVCLRMTNSTSSGMESTATALIEWDSETGLFRGSDKASDRELWPTSNQASTVDTGHQHSIRGGWEVSVPHLNCCRRQGLIHPAPPCMRNSFPSQWLYNHLSTLAWQYRSPLPPPPQASSLVHCFCLSWVGKSEKGE